jgi:predicted glycosyltransferase
MAPRRREYFQKRVSRLAQVKAITFDPEVESVMAGAVGVVAMGGYNTFCEILTLDKRAIIVPRKKPRMEQYIRAARAQELGLVKMLTDDGEREPARMARALHGLAAQNQPSDIVIPGLLDGLDNIYRMVDAWLPQTFVAPIRVAT